jgi:cold shock protein
VSSRDRDFRPARRRGFDDDIYRPPTSNFGYPPPRGPQFDSPSGPPVGGTVKWYNPDKGFGFVQLADGSADAFLHARVLERGGHSSVSPGATLEVRIGTGPKGPQVTEILSLDTSTASQERPRPERTSYPPADRATVEEFGMVKWYSAEKGFGFIVRDSGGKDIFVHTSALNRAGIGGLGRANASPSPYLTARRDPRQPVCD